jgi:hypothetical protein
VSAIASLKRAPKWAWWTTGGLAIGAASIKVWKDRAKPPDGPADPAETVGDAATVGNGAPGAGVIVPPVIIPASDDGGLSNVAGIMDQLSAGWEAVLGSALAVDDTYANVYNPVLGLIPGLIDQAANGGGPPPPGNIIVNVPAPSAPAPAPHAPTPTPHTPAGPAPCAAGYPLHSAQGCYKVVCASGHGDKAKGRWHYYANGRQVHVSGTC